MQALIIAMAMIETNHLAERERDSTKDGDRHGSANASIFNLSEDLLRRLGYPRPILPGAAPPPWGDQAIHRLDPLSALPKVVEIIQRGIHTWGLVRYMNFVRGGDDGFNGGTKYDLVGYRTAVATILKLMDEDPSLITDDRRVEMNVIYQ